MLELTGGVHMGYLMIKTLAFLLLFTIAYPNCAHAEIPIVDGFSASIHAWNLTHAQREYERYAPHQYKEIADNLIAYQNEDGGWPKNIDWLAQLQPAEVLSGLKRWERDSTVDNWNTYSQIRYLAHVYTLTGEEQYKDSALRGLLYLLNTQDANGAWWGSDVKSPTLNDNVTTGVLSLFLDILYGDEHFSWLSDEYMQDIQTAFNHGLDFILRAQVVQSGVKTAWAQQYTNEALVPTGARAYELPAIASQESCYILNLLMDIRNPNDDVKESINSAVKWLRQVGINQFRLEKTYKEIPMREYPYDLIGVRDEKAPPIWSRYYDVLDNTPFMCTRKGEKVYDISELSYERRVGYSWYGYWPEEVFEKYAIWSKKHMTTGN